MLKSPSLDLAQYLVLEDNFDKEDNGIVIYNIQNLTPAIQANSYYFGHPEWARNYFVNCHRDQEFVSLWHAVIGNWNDKIVVDVGCGPGNLYAALKNICGNLV